MEQNSNNLSPTWLHELNQENIIYGPNDGFEKIFYDSFLWPSEMEGDLSPVIHLKKHIYSFVFFGFTFPKTELIEEILHNDKCHYKLVASCTLKLDNILNENDKFFEIFNSEIDQNIKWMIFETSYSSDGWKMQNNRITILNIPIKTNKLWIKAIESFYFSRGIHPRALLARQGMAGLGVDPLMQLYKSNNMEAPEILITREGVPHDARPSEWDTRYELQFTHHSSKPFNEVRGIYAIDQSIFDIKIT